MLWIPAGIWLLGMIGCNETTRRTLKENDGSVEKVAIAGDTFTVCKFDSKKDTIDVPLSEFVEDFRIIRFENADQAYFNARFITVTDNYIGTRQERNFYKLFDKQGKFLCNVGAVGNGPGEYQYLYDDIIDEKDGRIFLAPFTDSKIWVYGIDGKWIKDIPLPFKINKPRMYLNPDGTLSVVHMSFSEEEPFAFQVDLEGNILKTLPTTANRKVETFDGEIFAPQNSGKLDFFHTSIDTIFRYDATTNQLQPRFAMDFQGLNDKPIHIFLDLPHHTIVNYYFWVNDHPEGGGALLIDKKKLSSAHFKLYNDYFGDMPVPANFNRGWFIHNLEPGNLQERIEKYLASGKCSDDNRKMLQDFAGSLQENDNNILFVGKLKQ